MKKKYNKKNHLGSHLLSLVLAVMLTVSLFPITARETKAAGNLSNPRIVEDSSMLAEQKVTWDCVWFGSYPQVEVITSEMSENYTALDKSLRKEGDVFVSDDVYNKLKNANGWDSNNDIMMDGQKYRRMKKSDATNTISSSGHYYHWFDDSTYHYFQYERIKWRVLHIEGNQALLLMDQVLDNQRYNPAYDPTYDSTYSSVTWETSTMRSWLNNTFLSSAFTSSEQEAIQTTEVKNEDNKDYGTSGGNNTKDKVFLLSESEVYGTGQAQSYGFVDDNMAYDEARGSQSSTYAKAMGTWSDTDAFQGNAFWWLRSPGSWNNDVADVSSWGTVSSNGGNVYNDNDGVRAALNLNLSSNLYSYAGTVCSDGTVDENAKPSEGDNNSSSETDISKPATPSDISKPTTPSDAKNPVKVSKITLSGISKKIAAGKKITLKAVVSPSNAGNKKMAWKSSNTKVATVNSNGVVTIKKKTGGKSVTITATAKDDSGKKATYQIKVMKGVVKKVTVSGKKSVKAGKTLKLKAKVTASKGANKKLKWTSSNPKYATVTSSGKVKAFKAGKGKKVKITAMATDGSGKKKTVTVQINFISNFQLSA